MKHIISSDTKSELQPTVKMFLDDIPNLADSTRKGYIKIIDELLGFIALRFVNENFPNELKRKVFVAWIKALKQHYSTSSVYKYARVATCYLCFLERTGVLRYNAVSLLLTQYPKQGLAGIVTALTGQHPQKSLQRLKSSKKFSSPFGKSIKQYIFLGQSQGKRYKNEAEVLDRFDQFLMSYKNPPMHLSDSILKKWISLSLSYQPPTQYLNFIIVRRFCVYLSRLDSNAYIPDENLVPSKYPTLLPYVYSRVEIARILKAAQQLKPSKVSPIRPQTYYLLILLLYTTGLRRGEALKLELRDIDWNNQILRIREGKCFKSRIVPMSTSVTQELKSYIQHRASAGLSADGNAPLFQNPHSVGHLSKSAITTTFAGILEQLTIKQANGRRAPCIHSLRHTMAVHRLEQWYRCGADVQTKLCLLSTYLGHVHIGHTQRYLTMTAELLHQASHLYSQYSSAELLGEGK